MKDWDFGTYNAVRCLGMEMPVWYFKWLLVFARRLSVISHMVTQLTNMTG